MNKTVNYTDSSSMLPTSIDLPTELWLQILENSTIYDANHLWTTVRHVSRPFLDYVERLFMSTYLPKFAISLALPRRDPTTGALRWPGDPIPGAQIVMSFDHVTPDQRYVVFKSPVALKDGLEMKTVEEFRETSVLPKERLQDAPAWVYLNKNPLTGLSMDVPADIQWDGTSKVWFWRVDWRRLVSIFYKAKQDQKMGIKSAPVQVNQRRVMNHGRRS
ncbi:Nn.00g108890.m01.CDS01 [Neocucurbitaria sp. VM-36]